MNISDYENHYLRVKQQRLLDGMNSKIIKNKREQTVSIWSQAPTEPGEDNEVV